MYIHAHDDDDDTHTHDTHAHTHTPGRRPGVKVVKSWPGQLDRRRADRARARRDGKREKGGDGDGRKGPLRLQDTPSSAYVFPRPVPKLFC